MVDNGIISARNSSLDALKIISKENADEMLDFVESEIQLLSEIKHDYIVAMREYYVVNNSWYIRMELMEVSLFFIPFFFITKNNLSLFIFFFFRKAIYLNI